MKNKENNSNNKPVIIIICGPTCIGKTSVGIKLAKGVCGEIINADSMQVYKYMNIGTAKPTPSEQKLVPHYMLDIINPDELFDVAMFVKKAEPVISKLYSQNKIPFIVGGTGLYIKALLYGLSPPGPANPKLMKCLKNEAEKYGSNFLHEKLSRFDKDAAEKIHPNDTFRLVRAIITFEMTGKTISEYHKEHMFSEKRYNVLKIGLNMDRNKLYQRINTRVDMMLDAGLLNEVKMLLDMGYSETLNSMKSIGYRHVNDYIQNRFSWDETVRLMKRDTRRYAKRQLTWFGADQDILWVNPDSISLVEKKIEEFLLKERGGNNFHK